MKNLLIVVLVVALLMVAPLVLAEESSEAVIDDSSDAIALYNDTSNLPEGIVISPSPTSTTETPEISEELNIEENETISNLEVVGAQVRTWFTFNQEKKAEQELKLARLRLIQARIAAKNNNTIAMEKALEAHERIISRVQERMNKIRNASNPNDLNASAMGVVGLERAILVHEARINRFNELLTDANLTQAQRDRIENRISHAETVTTQLKELNAEKKEQIKTGLMTARNITEEEADDLIEQRTEKVQQTVENKEQNRGR